MNQGLTPNFYNTQRNNEVKHSEMKFRCNNKLFPPMNVINGKTPPHGIKATLRN